jgi:phosphate transport system permease protein
MRRLLLLPTLLSALAVGLLFGFLLWFSLPLIREGGLGGIFASVWDPDRSYGLLPMIAGSLAVALPAALLGLLFALGTALWIDAAGKRGRAVRRFYSLLASVPTVVYGFVGVMLLVPLVRGIFGGSGLSILSAALMLSLVITPTMVLFFVDSFSTAPREYRGIVHALGGDEGAYQRRVLLPFRLPSLLSGFVLGLGRALGDTMIALMLAGNSPHFPSGALEGARTLTSHIALLFAGDFDSLEFRSIFAAGLLLFLLSILLLLPIRLLRRSDGR